MNSRPIVGAIVLLLALILNDNALAIDKTISSYGFLGCSSRPTFEKLWERMVQTRLQNNMGAFYDVVQAGLQTGQCTRFSKGESVFVEDTVTSYGLIKVRRKADNKQYWTRIEAVN